MRKIFYEKVGRRYVPVREYDSDFLDSFPQGNHLVMCYPGGKSTRYNVDPALAPMIAAGRVAEDVMSQALVKASELKPSKKPITPEQKLAWENLAKAFGQEMYTLHGTSAADIVKLGLSTMQQEAEKLMKHEAVRQAYEHFITVAKLCSDCQDIN